MTPLAPERWHKELCKVSGYLAIRIEKRSIGSAVLRDFATRLEHVARQMREAAAASAKDDAS